jgi:hypothetical protein
MIANGYTSGLKAEHVTSDGQIAQLRGHCAIKRLIVPMLGFKSMHCAKILLAGIEMMHLIRKGQLDGFGTRSMPAGDQFFSVMDCCKTNRIATIAPTYRDRTPCVP